MADRKSFREAAGHAGKLTSLYDSMIDIKCLAVNLVARLTKGIKIRIIIYYASIPSYRGPSPVMTVAHLQKTWCSGSAPC